MALTVYVQILEIYPHFLLYQQDRMWGGNGGKHNNTPLFDRGRVESLAGFFCYLLYILIRNIFPHF